MAQFVLFPLAARVRRQNRLELQLPGGPEVTLSSAAQPTDPQDGQEGLTLVMSLLSEALRLIDRLDVSPEIGARLQHVIDSLEELRRDGEPSQD